MTDPNIIHGRPDFGNPDFGITYAKRFPPYVFLVNNNAALIHKIAKVRLRWWEAKSSVMVRLHKPTVTAVTVCGVYRRLEPAKTRTCMIPRPDAIRCVRCFGIPEPAPFGRDGWCTKEGITRTEAHVKLGCVVEGY